MMQFVDEADLRDGVGRAVAINALIEFLRKAVWDYEIHSNLPEQ